MADNDAPTDKRGVWKKLQTDEKKKKGKTKYSFETEMQDISDDCAARNFYQMQINNKII